MHDKIKHLKWWNDEINSKTYSYNILLIIINVTWLSYAKLLKILRWNGWSSCFLKSIKIIKIMDKAMNQNLNEFDADKNTENML